MFKNYIKIAWRSLFKNKFHTGINLVGLFIGFSIGILVLLAVYGQFSYDKSHANRKKIFQAYQVFNRESGSQIGNVFGYPAAPMFKAEVPAIDKATRYLYGSNLVVYKEKEIDISTMMVDEDFLHMFSFPVAKGNAVNPLQNLTDVVITEAAAKRIFGNEDPIGKTIQSPYSGSKLKEMTVVAVLKDFPNNNSIRFDALARIENAGSYASEKNNWDNQHHTVFVMLKDNATQQQAEKQLIVCNKKNLPGWYESLKREGAKADGRGDIFATRLLPLTDLHFSPRISGLGNTVNKAEIYVILLVGLLIILIACFNFVNINLANAFTRSREIGVRKCLGAAKEGLFAQLWSESFLLCFVAFVLSMLFAKVLVAVIQQQTGGGMPLAEMMLEPAFLLLAFSLLLFVSFIAGGYPSWLMSKFQVVETLKGKVTLKRKSFIRSALIVVQFVIACIMISCTFIIYQQFKHLQTADLGLNQEYLISIPFHKPENGRKNIEKLRTRLASNPGVLSVSGSHINIGLGLDGGSSKLTNSFGYKEANVTTNINFVDADFLQTFGIKPIEGNDIDARYTADTLQHVILTESSAKQFNEKQLVGQHILVDSGAPAWNIVAVIPDFHLYSLREKKEPLAMIYTKNTPVRYCFIRTNAQNREAVMDALKTEMALLEPGREFKGSFVDENVENWYKQEKMMSFLFSIAAVIAIVLSCLGLLAMVLLIIQQRVKEIGVRKVLGADVPSLSFLISKDFLKLVVIAVLIATPISWLAMNKWLESFPYRITLEWWMFLLVALTAIVIAFITISFNTVRAATQNPVKSLRTE
ncbi:MAG: ABC transporter permease [Lacibacter sp.]